jgi:phage shock protein PspC (stress-responsive transcriptional regulator)
MKKTLTINLAGMVYNIDDDAYSKLKIYLEKIEGHFINEEDGKDILHDIEARIAEILNEKISNSRQVVTIDDINEIIKIMGEPNDFAGGEDQQQNDKSNKRNYRRMYRDPDARIIGGVCSGLGAYWNVDPTLIRIIFIVLAIFGLAGVLIYLILWIVLPEATTVAQKLEMRGESVNISNISDFIRDEFEHVKKNMNFKKTKK